MKSITIQLEFIELCDILKYIPYPTHPTKIYFYPFNFATKNKNDGEMQYLIIPPSSAG
jgi:hypothetical protein